MDAAQLLAKVSRSLHALMIYRLLLTPKLMMVGSGRKSLDNNDYVGCGDGFVVHDVKKVLKTISMMAMTPVMKMVIV